MKLRKTFVALVVAALTMIPVAANAGQCPDPDNPCDIQPIPSPLDPFCAKLPIC